MRREEARAGSLEFRDRVELRHRRFGRVLVMVVNAASACSWSVGARPSCREPGRVRVCSASMESRERRLRVSRPGHPPATSTAAAGWCADFRVRLDARRADAVLVERVVDQKGVVGVRLFDDPLHVGQREGSRSLAVAGLAGTPIATERLLIEELLAVELDAKLILAERL